MKFNTLVIILLSAATTFLALRCESAPLITCEIQQDDVDTIVMETLYDFIDNTHLITQPYKINKHQAALLQYAYNVAKIDGHKDPSVLQGLIWQESHAGGYPNYRVAGDTYGLAVGKRYYGVGQIKVSAAMDVFKRYPTDFPNIEHAPTEELIARLMFDDKFNIRVASKYLLMMGKNNTRPVNFAITAYNQGATGASNLDSDSWHYTISVHKHKDTFIKQFNKVNKIK